MMSEHLINSFAYYKLRLSVLQSPFLLLSWHICKIGETFSLSLHLVQQERGTVGLFNVEDFRLGAILEVMGSEAGVTIGQISLSQPKQPSGQSALRGHVFLQSGFKFITKIRR